MFFKQETHKFCWIVAQIDVGTSGWDFYSVTFHQGERKVNTVRPPVVNFPNIFKYMYFDNTINKKYKLKP